MIIMHLWLVLFIPFTPSLGITEAEFQCNTDMECQIECLEKGLDDCFY